MSLVDATHKKHSYLCAKFTLSAVHQSFFKAAANRPLHRFSRLLFLTSPQIDSQAFQYAAFTAACAAYRS